MNSIPPTGRDHVRLCVEKDIGNYSASVWGLLSHLCHDSGGTRGCGKLVVALPLGIVAGLCHGSWLDSVSVSLSVLGLSIPNFWLGLLLITFFSVKLHWLPSFGTGGWQHLVMPAITAYIARLLRSSVIQGLSSDHILPGARPAMMVLTTVGTAKGILSVSALGFLGFGVQPPDPEWGSLLMEGKDYLFTAPHLSIFPGLCIMATVMMFNLAGDKIDVLHKR